MDELKSTARRTFRAASLRSNMDALGAKIEKASKQLPHLNSALSALKIEQVLAPKIDTPSLAALTEGVFVPRTNTPALTGTVKLNFGAKDTEWRPVTPEAILKQSVLSSDSSVTVTAANGVLKSACGVVGMADIGKTVALRGLAYDEDIRTRFPEGVLFMTLGQGASFGNSSSRSVKQGRGEVL